jgi:polyphosphate kinase 2 PPK2
VLQGIDAAGKDSTIKHVMSGVNPQAVEVRAFKRPSAEELNHDFLWRYQRALPGRAASTISCAFASRAASMITRPASPSEMRRSACPA